MYIIYQISILISIIWYENISTIVFISRLHPIYINAWIVGKQVKAFWLLHCILLLQNYHQNFISASNWNAHNFLNSPSAPPFCSLWVYSHNRSISAFIILVKIFVLLFFVKRKVIINTKHSYIDMVKQIVQPSISHLIQEGRKEIGSKKTKQYSIQ